jgi:hypothetical protein
MSADPAADLVSVVMPVYNAAATVRRALDSVLAQSHAQVEVFAVDDGSKDDSWAILETYAAADARVKPIRLAANAGVAAARNTGLDAASGRYIAFLDSDDWWSARKLERQLAVMRDGAARISYACFERVDEDGRSLSIVRPPPSVTHAQMLQSNHIAHSTGIYERSLGAVRFRRMGHEDYVFWLELIRLAGRAVRVPDSEPQAWYLVREGSVSSNKLRAAGWQWRIYRDIEKLGVARSAWLMGHYVRHALRKRR